MQSRKSFSTSTILVWWKWSTGCNHNKFSRHEGYKNTGWTDLTTCELSQKDFSRLSILMLIVMQECQSSRIWEVFSPLLQSTERPVAFGDCHFACHQSPMPSESEPVYVEPVLEAQVDTSKDWLCKKAFQDLKILPQAWSIHSTQKSMT